MDEIIKSTVRFILEKLELTQDELEEQELSIEDYMDMDCDDIYPKNFHLMNPEEQMIYIEELNDNHGL